MLLHVLSRPAVPPEADGVQVCCSGCVSGVHTDTTLGLELGSCSFVVCVGFGNCWSRGCQEFILYLFTSERSVFTPVSQFRACQTPGLILLCVSETSLASGFVATRAGREER